MKRRMSGIVKEESGFSTLQNIMIAVIAVILVSVGGYVFYGYIRASYQVKENNTAQKVYDAAENYLESQEQMGLLEDFNRKASHFGGVIGMKQQQEIWKSQYKGTDFEAVFTDYQERYREVPVRFLMLESQKAATEDRKENPILEMLEYEVLDENIKNHTFLIEYNGNTGEVFAVLYSEKVDTFTYEGDSQEKENVILRDATSLNRKWQGFCGKNLEDL